MPATPEYQPLNTLPDQDAPFSRSSGQSAPLPSGEEVPSEGASQPALQEASTPQEGVQNPPLEAQEAPATAQQAPRPPAPSLPDSPLERARLESQGKIPLRSEADDRSTMVAFGLLFVVPILIILLSVLLLLPFINAQLTQDPDPGGATVQTGPNLPPPTR